VIFSGTQRQPRSLFRVEHLLKFLPTRQPLLVRYGVSAILVAIFFVLRLGAGEAAGQYSFILFIPPILLASIIFDRGSGFAATALSVLLVGAMVDWSADRWAHVAALTLFAVISVFIVVVGEGMRKALERQVAAQQEAELLLQEQGHRIKNDLAIASSLITLQARGQKDATVRAALEDAVARLDVLAKSHDYLRITTGDQATRMQDYLSEVCWKLADALRGIRPIAVEVRADDVLVESEKATRLGLIVNELVTNALKHAFADDRAGTIRVSLRRMPGELVLVVEDDGAGCAEDVPEGLGSRLVRLLVQQLRGRMTREPGNPGCRVIIAIPPPPDGTTAAAAQGR
jgi:two-component sensor histidine kinase